MTKQDQTGNEVESLMEDFLSIKRVAVIGVSRDAKDYTRMIYRRFKESGFETFAVNPKAAGTQEIDGDVCYSSVTQIPGTPVDGAFLVTHPDMSALVAKECVDHGVTRVWMHRSMGQGSYSPEAERYCREHGVSVITKGCVMMYCQADLGHRLIRWMIGCPKVECAR